MLLYIFVGIATLLIINCANKYIYSFLKRFDFLLQLIKNRVILVIFEIFALNINCIIDKSNT